MTRPISVATKRLIQAVLELVVSSVTVYAVPERRSAGNSACLKLGMRL